jgi:hypothetical protein
MGQGFRLEIHASPIFVPLTFASGYLFSVALSLATGCNCPEFPDKCGFLQLAVTKHLS